MRMSLVLGAVALSTAGAVSAANIVRVSDFGYDVADSTRFVQAALDSGARQIIFDRREGPWIVTPVRARSNQAVVFEDGVELQAKKGAFMGMRDYLFECTEVSNVTLVGRGRLGGTFRMRKQDYIRPPYPRSEWRYALRIHESQCICVSNMSFIASGGDGIVVGGNKCRDIVIDSCVCDDNYRQAISVCCVRGLRVLNSTLSNTSGALPSAGIDFEPDRADEQLTDCLVRNCRIVGNRGYGVLVFPCNLRKSSSPLDITVADCMIVGNGYGVSATLGDDEQSSGVRGHVLFTNCVVSASGSRPVEIARKPSGTPITFVDCIVSNEYSSVSISDSKWELPVPDGVMFRNLTAYYPEGVDWFAVDKQSLNPNLPGNVVGSVTVIRPSGRAERIELDENWRRRHLGSSVKEPLPRRLVLDMDARGCVLKDSAPGRMVPLAPYELLWGARYVFFADRPGKIRFRMRQCRKHDAQKFHDTYAGFVKRHLWQKKPLVSVPQPGFESKEFAFDVPERGFYHLVMPAEIARFVLEEASVPVGIFVGNRHQQAYFSDDVAHSLWLNVPVGTKFAIVANSGSRGTVNVEIGTTNGKMLSCGQAGSLWRAFCATGDGDLCRIDMKDQGASGDGRYFIFDMVGVPPVLFLSKEKTVVFPAESEE